MQEYDEHLEEALVNDRALALTKACARGRDEKTESDAAT